MIKIDGKELRTYSKNSKIFVTSDLHFCHDKDFLYGTRGFNSIGDHNANIIYNWNSLISPYDVVFVLGDLMLNNNYNGIDHIEQLNGTIFVTIGNHDTAERVELYRKIWNVYNVQYAYNLKYNGYNFFLSHYPTITSNNDFDKPLKRRIINLCGHSHTKDCFADWDKGYIFHTELDTNNNQPWLLDDIINKIEEKVKYD